MLGYEEQYTLEAIKHNFKQIYKVQTDSDVILVKCSRQNYKKSEKNDIFSINNEMEQISNNKNLSSNGIKLHKIFFNPYIDKVDYPFNVNDYCKKITIINGIFEGTPLIWNINIQWKTQPNLFFHTLKYNQNILEFPLNENCQNKNILFLVKYKNNSTVFYDYYKNSQLYNAAFVYLFDKESDNIFVEPCGAFHLIYD
uniref:DUF7585 domain-containing protein n=1 Tax=Strongyloides stercoralis TaxID=6248 RepID=A0A0K0EFE7_STRER